MKKKIRLPMNEETRQALRAGDRVLLSGLIYTARDAAHQRMTEALLRGEDLPIPLADATIYYAGPTPASPGRPIGSIGPTTSGRMDGFTPRLLDLGLHAMIGKGPRSEEVLEAMKRNKAVYFAAVGGAGALIAKTVLEARPVAYDDLGTEAILALTVENFPAIVAIDSTGRNLYNRQEKPDWHGEERIQHD